MWPPFFCAQTMSARCSFSINYCRASEGLRIPNAKPFSFEPHERVWHKARNNISL
jgi:hypothetical protein